jgi:hypothetical protein
MRKARNLIQPVEQKSQQPQVMRMNTDLKKRLQATAWRGATLEAVALAFPNKKPSKPAGWERLVPL